MKALHVAAQTIKAGDADIIIAAGFESMSLAPSSSPVRGRGFAWATAKSSTR